MRFVSRQNRTFAFVSSAIVFTICLLTISGYSQSPAGTLQGEVQDATHGRIASATVVIRSLGTSLERQANTDSRGEFRFPDLQSGNYRVIVNAKGFSEASSNVSVQVSNVRDVLVTLRPAAVQQTVNVKAEASSITTEELDTTDAVNGGVVTQKDLQDIPLAARSFAEIGR